MIRIARVFSDLRFLALVLLCVGIGPAVGQTLPHKSYTSANGLGNDYIDGIVRDSRGFMWFCTGEGLSRFDGYEFKTYSTVDGLPHRSVNDLIEADDGTFLVATSDGLAVFDPYGTAAEPAPGQQQPRPMFRTMRRTEAPFDKFPFRVNALSRLPDGRILVTATRAVYFISKSGPEWQFERLDFDAWHRPSFEFSRAIPDKRGNIWIGTSDGIWWLEPNATEPVQISKIAPLSLFIDRHDYLWAGIGAGDGALTRFRYDPGTQRPVFDRTFRISDGLPGENWFHDFTETSDGKLWVATSSGVAEFRPEAGPDDKSFVLISKTKTTALGEDSGGNLWLGTSDRGAIKITRRGLVLFELEERQPYLSPSSIFTTPDGSVYVTSSDNDLFRFDGTGFVEANPFRFLARSWGWNQLDLRSKIDGEWWIPGHNGLFQYPAVDFRSLSRTPPKKIYSERDGLPANDIFRVFEDSRGDVWFSHISKPGLMRWIRREEKVQVYDEDDGHPGIAAPTAFGEDSAGNLWIGYYLGGAARFRNGKFETYPAPAILPPSLVNAFHRDSRGRLWMGVSNGGVFEIENPDGDRPGFRQISIAEGLSSVQVNCITEDKLGRIYVGTAKGINRIDPETGRIKVFSQDDGLPGANISRCAADANGDLWFAQRFTIARMTPETGENAPPPPVFISEVRANGALVRKLSELGETAVEDIRLETDQRRVQIGFFSLAFGTGEKITYQYRIDSGEWSDPITERTIVLNQSPGSFRFEVRALNSQGIASGSPAYLTFSIAYPVWQRWWFLALLAIVIGLIIYLIYRYKVTRILELERVRTRIATDLHDDIGSSLSQIAILSEVARQRKDTTEPLDLIAQTSRETLDSMSDIVWAINPSKDSLHDLLQRMRRFASEVFDAQDVAASFDFPEDGTATALGANVRREVYLMFKECVNNVAKHAAASNVEIRVRLAHNRLTVRVADDGRGFHVPALDEHATHEGFGGNGLVNLRRRALNLGGEIRIESSVGQGSVIEFEVPLDRSWLF